MAASHLASILVLLLALLPPPAHTTTSNDGEPTLAAFNIQTFGVTKMSKPEVVADIVTILHTFDFVAVQEIRDKSGAALVDLVAKLNENQTEEYHYHAVAGPREGSSVTYKEQYAFVYRPSRLRLCNTFAVSNEPRRFERAPFVAILDAPSAETGRDNSSACGSFLALVLHAKPDSASVSNITRDEIDALADAYTEASQRAHNITNAVLMGDFNADCTYLPEGSKANVRVFRQPFQLHVNDTVRTNVRETATPCAYDRIVTHGDAMLSAVVAGSVRVVDVQQDPYLLSYERALAVSDHYPVSFRLSLATLTGGSNAPSDGEGSHTGIIIGVIVAVVVLTAGVLAAVWFVREHKKNSVTYA